MERSDRDSGQALFTGSVYVRRVVDDQLDEYLPDVPAILLDGPKGVGKTATALQRARTVRRLDDVAQRAIAEADPNAVLDGSPPVLLDEWQYVPEVWNSVKRAVDADMTGGRFLLTGSPPQPGTPVHSGAGRIAAVRMRPLTLPERGSSRPTVSLAALLTGERAPVSGTSELELGDYVDLILRSGLPGLQKMSGRALRAHLDGYIDQIVQRDMAEAGFTVRQPATLHGWMAAYAAATSTTASWEKIRNAAATASGAEHAPAKTTAAPYVNALSALRILDEVPAWTTSANHLNRLVASPKHHLADPALAARLVGVNRADLLEGKAGAIGFPRDGTFLGALFESLATLSVRVFAQAAEARVSHLRTREGRREVDLIVERDGGGVVAFEVKLTSAADNEDVRHLRWLGEQIGDRLLDAVVVTTGPQAYRRADGIAVVPLGLLGP